MEASNASVVAKKTVIINEYLAIKWMTGEVWTTTVTLNLAVYSTDRYASVNLVYHNQHGRPRRTEENRTEFICTQR